MGLDCFKGSNTFWKLQCVINHAFKSQNFNSLRNKNWIFLDALAWELFFMLTLFYFVCLTTYLKREINHPEIWLIKFQIFSIKIISIYSHKFYCCYYFVVVLEGLSINGVCMKLWNIKTPFTCLFSYNCVLWRF